MTKDKAKIRSINKQHMTGPMYLKHYSILVGKILLEAQDTRILVSSETALCDPSNCARYGLELQYIIFVTLYSYFEQFK